MEKEIHGLTEKEKNLSSVVDAVAKNSNAPNSQLKKIMGSIDAITNEITVMDGNIQKSAKQSLKTEFIQNELDSLRKSIMEEVGKTIAESESQLSDHSIIENKNFETIKNP